jgi:hypothetical protein
MKYLLSALLLVLLSSPLVKADGLVLTIANPNQTITYADLNQYGAVQVNFDGHLFNSANESLTINSYAVEITQQIGPLGLAYNQQFPATLAPLTTTNDFQLFDLGVALWNTHAPAHVITGTFTVSYFYPNSIIRSSSQNFSINVPAGINAPEPVSGLLLLTGLSVLLLKKFVDR